MSTVPGVVGGVSVPSSATPAPVKSDLWSKVWAEALTALDRAVIAGISVFAGVNITNASTLTTTDWKVTGVSAGLAAAGSLLVSLRNLLPSSPAA